MMATFMAAVENTIVGTAMPSIVAALGDFHLFSWVFVAYLLFQAVSIPIYGRAESLNLSTAAAVCLYASARAQRC